MVNKQTRTIEVAGVNVELPPSQYRKIQALIKQGRKIDAVVIVRQYAGVGVRMAKASLEDAANFEQPSEQGNRSRHLPSIQIDLAQLRQWVREYPLPVLGSVLAAFLLSTAIFASGSSPTLLNRTDPVVWYQDLNNRQLFSTVYRGSPIQSPTDKAFASNGVRAVVLTCGSCSDDAYFVGYLERFTDKAKQAHQQLDNAVDDPEKEDQWSRQLTAGHLVRGEDDDQWIGYDSDQGIRIRNEAMNRCKPSFTKPCHP